MFSFTIWCALTLVLVGAAILAWAGLRHGANEPVLVVRPVQNATGSRAYQIYATFLGIPAFSLPMLEVAQMPLGVQLIEAAQKGVPVIARDIPVFREVAGDYAFAMFALGIVGTGLLAVPVLAGSAAYAVTEMAGIAGSLDSKPLSARLFYGTIAATTLAGAALSFVGIDPAKALYWSAVVNGVLAGPLMVVMMLIVRNPRAMGEVRISTAQQAFGWASTVVMILASMLFLAFAATS